MPTISSTDLLVRNHATGVNPIDYRVRAGFLGAPIDPSKPVIVGWDGCGVVEQVGKDVTGFEKGDEVYYSGDVTKQGSYAEYTCVDHRVVAKKPKSLSFTQAAAVPLVAITAYELLHEIFQVKSGETVLIWNGAGGVGSIGIQLAKLAGLKVIATAGRDETNKWCKSLGADYILDHHTKKPVKEALKELGVEGGLDYVMHLHEPDNMGELIGCLKPFGKAGAILSISSEGMSRIDTVDMFMYRKSLCFEMMFARTMSQREPERQGRLLKEVAELYDEGKLKDIKRTELDLGDAKKAQEVQESGKSFGKIVMNIP